jgi:hypothetical protein
MDHGRLRELVKSKDNSIEPDISFMRPGRLSPSALSSKHRLPLLTGTLLPVSIVPLVNLDQKLASLSQQSSSVQIARTCTVANGPASNPILISRPTYSPASAVLTQFPTANDPAVDFPKDKSEPVTGHLLGWRRASAKAETTPALKVLLAENNPQPPLMAEERDIVESYANVVKPVDFHQFRNAVKQIGVFWTLVNEAPPDGATVG